jgi:hypothetical protein
LWARLEIFRYLRHQKEFAYDSLPIGENRKNKFQSVQDILHTGGGAFAPQLFYNVKKRPAVRGLKARFYGVFKVTILDLQLPLTYSLPIIFSKTPVKFPYTKNVGIANCNFALC